MLVTFDESLIFGLLFVARATVPRRRYKIPGESSDEEPEPEPPGSPEPEMFTVAGPGLAGGAAGTPTILTITARDADRRRITEGGDDVEIVVTPGTGCDKEAEALRADVTDRGDGSYVARFTVPCKGNWKIVVRVEGIEVDGSPYPVYFGPPGSLDTAEAEKAAEEALAAAAAAPGAVAGAPKVVGSLPGSNPMASAVSIAAASAGNPLAAAAAAAAAFSATQQQPVAGTTNSITAAMASAAAAAAAGATFINPLSANPLHQQLVTHLLAAKGVVDAHNRCVVVTKFPPGLDSAAIKTLMAVAGQVADVQLTGNPGDQLALVEYSNAAETATALSLNGMRIGDIYALQVFRAPAVSYAELLAINPMMAMHMQNMHQAQAAMLQSQALIAQLRAASGLPVDAGAGGAGEGQGAGTGDRMDRSRSRSPPAFLKERRRQRERQLERMEKRRDFRRSRSR